MVEPSLPGWEAAAGGQLQWAWCRPRGALSVHAARALGSASKKNKVPQSFLHELCAEMF